VNLKRLPGIGLIVANPPMQHFLSGLYALTAVVLGTIGVWLPALIKYFKGTSPVHLPRGVVDAISAGPVAAGDLLMVVPSLLVPCALLLFGPWQTSYRVGHQVTLLASTAVIMFFAVVFAVTQISAGVADKTFLVEISWWFFLLALLMLYFYELLDRLDPDIVTSTRNERDRLLEKLMKRVGP
jgi:hypothetical protein